MAHLGLRLVFSAHEQAHDQGGKLKYGFGNLSWKASSI